MRVMDYGWLITLIIFVAGVIWRASSEKSGLDKVKDAVKDSQEYEEKMSTRASDIEKEQTRIIEALDRTYATKEFVYAAFITKDAHHEALARVEERLIIKMEHISKSLDKLYTLVEKRGTNAS